MPSPTSPAEMDAILHDASFDLNVWLNELPENPLKQVRALQVAIAYDDLPLIRQLLTDLPMVAPGLGVRMMALSALSAWEDVLAQPPVVTGVSPLELECLVQAHTARAMASAQVCEFEAAVISSNIAQTLAAGLGMKNRCQMLGLEMERLMTLTGRPAPEKIQMKLMEPMSAIRRRWGQRNLAESHMALGSYGAALRSLGHQSQDAPEDAALREYLHAVLRLPPARMEDDPMLLPALPYTRLARAGRGMPNTQKILDLDGIIGEPQASYATLLKASALYKTPGMLQEAADLFASVRTVQPDQIFYRKVFLLACYVSGATIDRPHMLVEQINGAVEQMRPDGEVLSAVFAFAPEAFTLLIMAGKDVGIHPRIRNFDLLRIPMLAGKVVRYAGQEHELPGRCGRYEVLEAMGIPQDPLYPQEQKRMREALADLPPRRVNLGWVANGCLRMIEAARAAKLPTMALTWREAYTHVCEKLTADVLTGFTPLAEAERVCIR